MYIKKWDAFDVSAFQPDADVVLPAGVTLDFDKTVDLDSDTSIDVPDGFVFNPPSFASDSGAAFASGIAEVSFYGFASGGGGSSVSGSLSAGVGNDGSSFASGDTSVSGDYTVETLDLSALSFDAGFFF